MEIDPENPLMIYLNEPSIRLGVDQMTKPEFTVFPTTAAVSNRSFNISNRGANLIENMGDGDIMGIEPGSDTLIMSMRARPNVTPAQERPRFISVAIPITVYKQ